MARAGTRYRAPVWYPPALGAFRHLGTLALRSLGRAAVLFWRDNCMGMAGMIAFFGFLSLVPLALLLLAVLGNVFAGIVTDHEVQTLFHGVMPGLSKTQFLSSYWEPIKHSHVTTTILGFVSLLFGTLGLHDSVDWAVNRIWRSPTGRSFWLSKLRGLGVIVWVTGFVLLTVGLTWLWAEALGLTHAPSPLAAVVALVPSFLLDWIIFSALFTLTPMVRADLRLTAASGVVTAVLWELSKLIFGWWVLQAGTYNRVYGPLAASVIVMLWLWISGMIFLYGAALAAVLQGRDSPPPPLQSLPRV
jgi:membrane protein